MDFSDQNFNKRRKFEHGYEIDDFVVFDAISESDSEDLSESSDFSIILIEDSVKEHPHDFLVSDSSDDEDLSDDSERDIMEDPLENSERDPIENSE